jgi:hypothetical protein
MDPMGIASWRTSGEIPARKIQCLQVVRIGLAIQLLGQVVIDGGVIELIRLF